MLVNIIQNTIGGLISAGFSIVREGLKMFLPLRYSQQLGEELVKLMKLNTQFLLFQQVLFL